MAMDGVPLSQSEWSQQRPSRVSAPSAPASFMSTTERYGSHAPSNWGFQPGESSLGLTRSNLGLHLVRANSAPAPFSDGPSGFLFKKGERFFGLTFSTGARERRRWFVLDMTKRELSYLRESESSARSVINLSRVQRIDTSRISNGNFSIVCADRIFELRAPTEEEGRRWVSALEPMIQQSAEMGTACSMPTTLLRSRSADDSDLFLHTVQQDAGLDPLRSFDNPMGTLEFDDMELQGSVDTSFGKSQSTNSLLRRRARDPPLKKMVTLLEAAPLDTSEEGPASHDVHALGSFNLCQIVQEAFRKAGDAAEQALREAPANLREEAEAGDLAAALHLASYAIPAKDRAQAAFELSGCGSRPTIGRTFKSACETDDNGDSISEPPEIVATESKAGDHGAGNARWLQQALTRAEADLKISHAAAEEEQRHLREALEKACAETALARTEVKEVEQLRTALEAAEAENKKLHRYACDVARLEESIKALNKDITATRLAAEQRESALRRDIDAQQHQAALLAEQLSSLLNAERRARRTGRSLAAARGLRFADRLTELEVPPANEDGSEPSGLPVPPAFPLLVPFPAPAALAEEEAQSLLTQLRAAPSEAPALLQQAPLAARGHRHVAFAACEFDGRALQHCSAELRSDHQVVMAAVAECGRALEFAATAMRDDPEVVRRAVAQDGRALEHASNRLRRDAATVEAAVGQCPWAIRYVDPALRFDQVLALTSVARNGLVLRILPERLRAIREVVAAALAQNAGALEHAAAALRADRALVLLAVKVDGELLRHASLELRADREVVQTAVAQSGLAINWASQDLRNDKEFGMQAIQQNPMALQVVSENLRASKEHVIEAVKRSAAAIIFASEQLQVDGSVAVAAVEAPRPPKKKMTVI